MIVPTGYLDGPKDRSIRRPLIPGLEVALVEARGPETRAGYVRQSARRGYGAVDGDAAYELALDNRARLNAATSRSRLTPIQTGSSSCGATTRRAAACLLLPGVAQPLGNHAALALVPHRDVLVLFRDRDDRAAFVRDLLEAEKDGRKPISMLRVLDRDLPFPDHVGGPPEYDTVVVRDSPVVRSRSSCIAAPYR